jgi:hypothetical protein
MRSAGGHCLPVLLFSLLLCLVAGLGCGRDQGDGSAPVPEIAVEEETGAQWLAALEKAGAAEGNRLKVFIFYQSSTRNLLVPEENEIFRTERLSDQVKQVIELLARGPAGEGAVSALPPGTRLRSLFFPEDGLAVADFNGAMSRAHPGGVWGERATVYAVVDSLTFNFPSIRRVKIMVEGREVETLAGHLSLDRPFGMDLSMVGSPLAGPGGAETPAEQPAAQPPDDRGKAATVAGTG